MNEHLTSLDWKHKEHLDANSAPRRERSAIFATRSNLHPLQFFVSNEIENHEKHAYIHQVKSGTFHDVCTTGSRIHGAKTKRMNYSRISCTFFIHAVLLYRLVFYAEKTRDTITIINATSFHETVFCTSSFLGRIGKGCHMKRRERGRQNCHREKRHRCRITIDTYTHDDMRYGRSLFENEIRIVMIHDDGKCWHDRLDNDYVPDHDNDMIDRWDRGQLNLFRTIFETF